MSCQPEYFDRIRKRAAQRWDQLEQDPELAGPWHQLFKQVQSPRHILSELLQNADDAGATETSVSIKDQVFTFEHNGEDFAEEHFASLCRFGYSNKRALHTIGFRGIGFKSVFSLGDQVELYTPSLSIGFNRQRFTEPKWLPNRVDTQGRTQIRVEISDKNRLREVEKNLEEWVKSPVSLLFFKHIRCMRVGETAVQWDSLGSGPVPNSQRMALKGGKNEGFLLVRSDVEAFPQEALEEIRQERMIGTEDGGEFPPCHVEIVIGVSGRLYVVLPTGVETKLPFACNAPFIQDPARLKIKDPETSPTNRWLLKRAGNLAATAMLKWLHQAELPVADRARAYSLFSDVNRDDNSLEGVCGTIVEEALADCIDGKNILLTDSGDVVGDKQSVIIPAPVLDVWTREQATVLFDEEGRPPLCHSVTAADRAKLLRWDVISEITTQKILTILQKKHLPKPNTWQQLLTLWAYLAPEITGYHHYVVSENVRIVPVQGKDVLYSASEAVRLGEKRILQSDSDWEFLAKYLIVLNQNWSRFLAEQRRAEADGKKVKLESAVEDAYAVLEEIGLAEASDIDKIVEQVSTEFFAQENINLADCIQIAQIAAKLGADVGDSFHYVTRDRHLRLPKTGIIFDKNGGIEELLPPEKCETLLLHEDYSKTFKSCSKDEWLKWIESGSARLMTFIPLAEKYISWYGRQRIEQEARRRGLQGELWDQYKTSQYRVQDWDFDDLYWNYWNSSAIVDEQLWIKVVENIVAQKDTFWGKAKSARILHVATTHSTRAMTNEFLLPSWVLKLRERPCLPDTRGFRRMPRELLRRTPETESLLDVELFVHGRLDREANRSLLDLLGVQSIPTGPDRILDCLRALAKAENPPILEVEKWYRRLDQMFDVCSTADCQKIIEAFDSEKLLLTEDGSWSVSAAVFLESDSEDAPGAAVIKVSVKDLTLWRKIGVAERPTADLALAWLQSLPSGELLSQDDARRVRTLLVRHPMRIWDECKHWINLLGEWVPTGSLTYALTMQSLIPWRHLHQEVRKKTADLQRLPGEVTSNPPFSTSPLLSAQVEERFQTPPLFSGQAQSKEWLKAFGMELRRVELDAEKETARVRSLADSLSRTGWVEAPGLEIIPYIDGTPAGTARQVQVVWLDQIIYVEPLPKAKLARLVPEEISKAFARADIKAALDYSFERSVEDIREYLQENFSLSTAIVASENPVTTSDEEVEEQPTTTEVIEIEGDAVGAAPPDENEEIIQAVDDDESSITDPSDDADDDQPIIDDVGIPAPHPRPTPKPAKPSIIERFAKAQGFMKDGEGRYFHENGSWIGRAHDALFSWEHCTAGGELVRYYWPKDHCIELEPLQLEADIWGLIEKNPETYALILANAEDVPVEVTGTRLRALCEAGEIVLYPASYRLVYEHDRQK